MLIRTFMDQVTYNEVGNEVAMAKRRVRETKGLWADARGDGGGFMGGIKTMVNERVGFRFQSRLMTTYFQGDSGSFCSNTGVCFTVLGATLMNQIDLTAGVILTF